MKDNLSSDDLIELLHNRFSPPAWAFIPQVRNATGFLKVTRTADAIAMSLYPSRGLDLHGFEIKINRNDWLKELKAPEKAEEIAQFCDFWWVVSTKEIVRIEEMPLNWGLLIPHGSTMKIVKPAKLLKAKPIDHLFLAAILRRAQKVIITEAKLEKYFKEGEERGKESAKFEVENALQKYQNLESAVSEFEKISGVHINRWDIGNIGEAVRMVLNGEHLKTKERLQALLETAKNIAIDIEKQLSELEQKP